MISHVSNALVLERAEAKRATILLLQRQLELFGRIATSADSSPLREQLVCRGSTALRNLQQSRRAGRPRHYWPQMVRQHALKVAGDEVALEEMLLEKDGAQRKWKAAVSKYCKGITEISSV